VAGYSSTPLAKKLGLKEGCRVYVSGAPGGYEALLAPLPAGLQFMTGAGPDIDIAHVFISHGGQLAGTLLGLRKKLRADATVWVSWPKKSAGIAHTISENAIREAALPLGFVDVKVCAVDETWSGLKLVVRKNLR
jgi:hypothetical protein